jgi:hypothetical protein
MYVQGVSLSSTCSLDVDWVSIYCTNISSMNVCVSISVASSMDVHVVVISLSIASSTDALSFSSLVCHLLSLLAISYSPVVFLPLLLSFFSCSLPCFDCSLSCLYCSLPCFYCLLPCLCCSLPCLYCSLNCLFLPTGLKARRRGGKLSR